jgi:cytochrome c-type biogenesis protein CcmF
VYLLGAVVAVVVVSAVLIVWRLPLLAPAREPLAVLSREGLLVVTNLLLLAFTLAVFAGTLYPVVTRAVSGAEVTVGEPFFDRMTVPFDLFARNPRRWGGAVVHLGIVLLIVGVALDATYRSDERITLTVDETGTVGGYALTFASLDSEMSANRAALSATLAVAREGSGRPLGTIVTERSLLANQDQPRTSVGVRSLLREDVYVILEEVDVDSRTASFNVFLHPGVLWLWVGGGLLMLGGVLAVWPYRGRPAVGAGGDAAAVPVLVAPAAPRSDDPEVP